MRINIFDSTGSCHVLLADNLIITLKTSTIVESHSSFFNPMFVLWLSERKKQEKKLNHSILYNSDSFHLRNEFDFWMVHGIMNNSGLLQSK